MLLIKLEIKVASELIESIPISIRFDRQHTLPAHKAHEEMHGDETMPDSFSS